MKLQKRDIIAFIVIILALIPFLIYSVSLSAEMDTESGGYPVYISEILASNSLYPDENGICCDWVELHNSSDSAVDISNFGLSDNTLNIRYTFPEGTVIGAKEYFVVRCSDQHGEGYAPFNISKNGDESIVLISDSKVIISRVNTVPTIANHPMIITSSGECKVSDSATPGFPNTSDGRAAYIDSLKLTEAQLRITEIMPANTCTVPDSDGDFPDYVEITNRGENAVSLSGFYLSDKTDNLLQMRLPDITLEPGEYQLVFASGKNTVNGAGEVHAPFSLSADGETVTLCYPSGEIIDSVTYSATEDDRACIISDSGEITATANASPGFANSDNGQKAFLASHPERSDLVISEVMTSNFSHMMQQDGKYYDWVELQNRSSSGINLSDYYITDSTAIKDKCRLPDITLGPDEYFILICSGNSALTNDKYTHADITLSAEEESLYLYRNDAALIDYAHLINLSYGGSYGRMNDGSAGYFYFAAPTPGTANSGGKRTVTPTPFTNLAAGVYNDSKKLTIELGGGEEIRYTTDGTPPTSSSKLYTEPITIKKTTVIRAACFSPDALTGSTATFSYFLSENHTLPIVSLAVDPDDLWSDENGIYVEGNHKNYYQDWEKPANVSLFEDGKGFTIDCGLKLHGAGTRKSSAKKSFKVLFRPRYDGELNYKVFDDSPIEVFHSLLLRGGEDYSRTIFRDELCSTLAKQGSESLYTLNDKYCVLYINGEYFGIFSIRESYSEEYFAAHMGVSPGSVSIVRAPVYKQTAPELYKLIEFASKNSMTNEKNYRYIESNIDLDSLIDWYIFEAYCGNNDIPGNVRYVYSTETGKWQYCFYDLDWAFVWSGTCEWAFADKSQHSILFNALKENKEFRGRFLTRMNELMNTALTDENILKTIDNYAELLKPEIERERRLWGGSVEGWNKSVDQVRGYMTKHDRPSQVIASLDYYMNLSDAETEKYFGR